MSKLSKTAYPLENPKEWLIFRNSWQTDIDPIFAGRLAALAKYTGVKINISSGFRSTKEQIASFLRNGGSQDKNGNWIGGNGYAAKPGRSWHEFGEAIDTSDMWLKKLEKDASTSQQILLRKFGLFKPLTKGNKTSVQEDWHIQPIETNGVLVEQRKTFYEAYKADEKIKTELVKPEPVKQEVKKEGPEMWKQKIVEEALNLGLITDKTWVEKADTTPTVWFICAVAINLYNKLKGGK